MSSFGRHPADQILGNFVACYKGSCTDKEVLQKAASGGLITAVLAFALEKRLIDGAVVTRMSKRHPLRPETVIARTSEEILSASTSKYCPVAPNTVIRRLRSEKGKFAVVGLPCHIHGLRYLEALDPRLKSKICLHLGLFCNHGVSFRGTECLLHRMRLRDQDVSELSYRGNGWPGKMSVQLRNGTKRKLSYQWYWNTFFSTYFFTPVRCTFCFDGLNQLADLSFGDAWQLEPRGKDSFWRSLIISRTDIGAQLLDKAESEGRVSLAEISVREVVYSQSGQLQVKKKNLRARRRVFERLRRMRDGSSHNLVRSLGLARPSTISPYVSIFLSRNMFTGKILRYAPIQMINAYNKCYHLVDSFL